MKAEDIELLEKYQKGLLNEKERHAVELRLEKEVELSNYFEVVVNLPSAFGYNEANDLKAVLSKENSPSTISFYRKTLFKIAAAFVILIAVSLFLLNQKTEAVEVFAMYYEPYPNVEAPILRSGSLINQSFENYEAGNYDKALSLFQEMDETEAIIFYTAQCQIALGEYSEAVLNLKKIEQYGGKFTSVSNWYLALTYLQLNKELEAKAILGSLKESNSKYAEKANQILDSLD